jgi:hypothetical protein
MRCEASTQFGLGIKEKKGSQLPALAALPLRKSSLSTWNMSLVGP